MTTMMELIPNLDIVIPERITDKGANVEVKRNITSTATYISVQLECKYIFKYDDSGLDDYYYNKHKIKHNKEYATIDINISYCRKARTIILDNINTGLCSIGGKSLFIAYRPNSHQDVTSLYDTINKYLYLAELIIEAHSVDYTCITDIENTKKSISDRLDDSIIMSSFSLH